MPSDYEYTHSLIINGTTIEITQDDLKPGKHEELDKRLASLSEENAKKLVNARDIYGCTLLARAVCESKKSGTEDTQYLEILLKYGAEINPDANHHDDSALGCAIELNKPYLIKFLADNGADLERRSEMGYTPLQYAALEGYLEAVEALLKSGANVNTTCEPTIPVMKKHKGFTARMLIEPYLNEKIYSDIAKILERFAPEHQTAATACGAVSACCMALQAMELDSAEPSTASPAR